MAGQGNELGQRDAAVAFAILGLAERLELLEAVAEAARNLRMTNLSDTHRDSIHVVPADMLVLHRALAALDDGAGQAE